MTPWLRAAGHLPRSVRRVDDALAALDEEPVDLVIVDREPGGLDAPQACRVLRDDPRLGDAWLLVITVAGPRAGGGRRARRRRRRLPAPPVLALGADRARARRAARGAPALQRRAAARADGQRAGRDLPLRLARRLHDRADQRRDRAHLRLPARATSWPARSARCSASCIARTATWCSPAIDDARERDAPFSLEYRIVRADGAVRWVLDRGQLVPGPGRTAVARRRAVRHHRAARGRGGAAAARDRGGADRGAARLARPHRRGRRRAPGARSSATCTTARSSGW